MQTQDRLVRTSRYIVQWGIAVNRIFLVAVALGFVVSWVFPGVFGMLLIQPGADVNSVLPGMRLLLVIGIVMAVSTDRLLASLAAVVASAADGDPFVTANAGRLQTIGWWLLVLQLLDVPGALLGRFFPAMGSAAPDTGVLSVGGWLAVLMAFVLARVFAAGAAMRDELAGTV